MKLGCVRVKLLLGRVHGGVVKLMMVLCVGLMRVLVLEAL